MDLRCLMISDLNLGFLLFSNSISMYVTRAGMQGAAKITEP